MSNLKTCAICFPACCCSLLGLPWTKMTAFVTVLWKWGVFIFFIHTSSQRGLQEPDGQQHGGEISDTLAEAAPSLPCYPSPLLWKRQPSAPSSSHSSPLFHLHVSVAHAAAEASPGLWGPRVPAAAQLLGGSPCCSVAEAQIYSAGECSGRRVYS